MTRGQSIVRWDPAAVEASGKSPVCPVVALEATADSLSDLRDGGDVKAGDSSSPGTEGSAAPGGYQDNHRGGGTRRTNGDG